MLATIPDNSITLFDKLFYSADLLLTLNLQGCNCHWLLPTWKNIASETEESYGPRDRLLELKVSPQARKKNPSLPEFRYARAVTYKVNGVEKTVLTSLPADRYKAKEVAELYRNRRSKSGSSIGIKTPKRLKKHHKTDVSSTPLLLI